MQAVADQLAELYTDDHDTEMLLAAHIAASLPTLLGDKTPTYMSEEAFGVYKVHLGIRAKYIPSIYNVFTAQTWLAQAKNENNAQEMLEALKSYYVVGKMFVDLHKQNEATYKKFVRHPMIMRVNNQEMVQVTASHHMTFEEGCKVRRAYTSSPDFQTLSISALTKTFLEELQGYCTDPRIYRIVQGYQDPKMLSPSEDDLAHLGAFDDTVDGLFEHVKTHIEQMEGGDAENNPNN